MMYVHVHVVHDCVCVCVCVCMCVCLSGTTHPPICSIESFSISLKRFLALWQCALQAQVTTSDSSQALKMVVINIFNIHHVAQNSGKSDSSPTVSTLNPLSFVPGTLQLCTHNPVF